VDIPTLTVYEEEGPVRLGVVAHAYNLSYTGDRDQKDGGRKLVRPPSQISQTWWHWPVIPTPQEAWIGGLKSKANPRKKLRLYLNNN
jgi:hypothetical protein